MTQEGESHTEPVLQLCEVTCSGEGASLQQISLRFTRSSFNFFVGDAGASLLLRLASLLEPPESGEVFLLGESTRALDDLGRAAIRSRQFGFVFSSPYLLPGLSVAENVAMPLFKVLEVEPREAGERVTAALAFVGLHSLESTEVDTLRRYDQQRVALARALAHRPTLLVVEQADAGLSPEEAAELLAVVRRAPKEFDVTVLATLGLNSVAGGSDRVLAVEGGVVSRDSACASQAPTPQASVT